MPETKAEMTSRTVARSIFEMISIHIRGPAIELALLDPSKDSLYLMAPCEADGSCRSFTTQFTKMIRRQCKMAVDNNPDVVWPYVAMLMATGEEEVVEYFMMMAKRYGATEELFDRVFGINNDRRFTHYLHDHGDDEEFDRAYFDSLVQIIDDVLNNR